MKMRYTLVSLQMCIASVCLAGPEFVGFLVSQGTTHIAVRMDAADNTRWVRVGDHMGEYRVMGYDPQKETLLLRKGEEDIEVTLKPSSVQPAPTLTLLESLVRAGDKQLEGALQQARELDARRNKTASDLADLELRATNVPDRSVDVTQMRRKLRLEEETLAFYLQKLIQSARRNAGRVP